MIAPEYKKIYESFAELVQKCDLNIVIENLVKKDPKSLKTWPEVIDNLKKLAQTNNVLPVLVSYAQDWCDKNEWYWNVNLINDKCQ